MEENKITIEEKQQRIEFFTESIYKFQEVLGFNNTEISVKEQKNSETRASWYFDVSGQLGTIFYSKDWIEQNDLLYEEIQKVAFHEVYESQFYRIYRYMGEFYSEEFISEMFHDIVRKAENKILPAVLLYNK